jgi:hypothetical protein
VVRKLKIALQLSRMPGTSSILTEPISRPIRLCRKLILGTATTQEPQPRNRGPLEVNPPSSLKSTSRMLYIKLSRITPNRCHNVARMRGSKHAFIRSMRSSAPMPLAYCSLLHVYCTSKHACPGTLHRSVLHRARRHRAITCILASFSGPLYETICFSADVLGLSSGSTNKSSK